MSFTANQVGGEYKHLLSLDEMPSHAHKPHDWDIVTSQGGNTGHYSVPYQDNPTGVFNPFSYDKDKERYGSYVGNNIPHNNIQPYVVVYFWKRIK